MNAFLTPAQREAYVKLQAQAAAAGASDAAAAPMSSASATPRTAVSAPAVAPAVAGSREAAKGSRTGGRGSPPASPEAPASAQLNLMSRPIEFKGPDDSLESGQIALLGGCALLWHSQQAERVVQADISLIVLAPM